MSLTKGKAYNSKGAKMYILCDIIKDEGLILVCAVNLLRSKESFESRITRARIKGSRISKEYYTKRLEETENELSVLREQGFYVPYRYSDLPKNIIEDL